MIFLFSFISPLSCLLIDSLPRCHPCRCLCTVHYFQSINSSTPNPWCGVFVLFQPLQITILPPSSTVGNHTDSVEFWEPSHNPFYRIETGRGTSYADQTRVIPLPMQPPTNKTKKEKYSSLLDLKPPVLKYQ